MSQFLDLIKQRARADKQTIVLAEGDDERTLAAAEQILAEDIADLVILGNPLEIAQSGYSLDGATIVNPAESAHLEEFAAALAERRKKKGLTVDEARELLHDVLYFGVMMVYQGLADGMVAGACHATADVLRPSLQILKTAPNTKIVSSFFVMAVPECGLGAEGTFVFSDCGLNIDPDAEELSEIAISSAGSFEALVGSKPRVAMLSYSSMGSGKGEMVDKVREATRLAKEKAPELCLDGELQADAAIVPSVGAKKVPGSPVAGQANVLIFPDLNAGNIGYKLVQRLAKAEAYGPLTQGIAKPVNDLSRGCSAEDIVGVIAITAVQSQQRKTKMT